MKNIHRPRTTKPPKKLRPSINAKFTEDGTIFRAVGNDYITLPPEFPEIDAATAFAWLDDAPSFAVAAE
jgi:hypothetical protein